jgi:sigma-E factor negative regulatory protein RseC
MNNTRVITHEGVVVNANGTHVQVKIISLSACVGCHAKESCIAADMKEKIIDAIPLEPLNPCDPVIVKMAERVGWIAVFYGFFLPFLVLAVLLFSLPSLGFSETMAGLIAIASLIPYYIALYIFRKKFEKKIFFTAEKINKPSEL